MPSTGRILGLRMAHHLLLDGAPSLVEAAGQMLAIQSQDFAAGRYALALRSQGDLTREDVDAAFRSGELVRTWTSRGTLHICRAEDVRWLVDATRERTLSSLKSRHRDLGITPKVTDEAAGIVQEHLIEVGSASRPEIFAAWEQRGIATAGQRGVHLLLTLCLNGLICFGPVPDDATVSAQNLILLDSLSIKPQQPDDLPRELLRRYLAGHGPATVRDAAWYTGQTLGTLRTAASSLGEELTSVGTSARGEELWCLTESLEICEPLVEAVGDLPRRLLGPFDEYYLSYADRTLVADPQVQRSIGPGSNGMVKALWLVGGRAQGPWNADAAPTDELGAALHERYSTFRSH